MNNSCAFRELPAVKLFHILALLLTASAVFSYINHRFLKLPTVIGIMLVALALSLPAGEIRDTLVAVTYAVVIFSILVQGLTIGRLIRRIK